MSDPARETALIVFTRPPLPGQVKTRLAAHIGPDAALAVHRRLLDHTAALVRTWPGPVHVYLAAAPPSGWAWPDPDSPWQLQAPGDLGQRMADALERTLAASPAAMLIGTDCPALLPSHLQRLAGQLADQDAVLGPAVDGGYYLIGMHHVLPSLFADLPWSTDQVAALTRQRLRAAGWSWAEGPLLRDLDTPEDLQAHGWAAPVGD